MSGRCPQRLNPLDRLTARYPPDFHGGYYPGMGEGDLSSEQLRRDIERAARSRNLQARLAAEDAQKSQLKGQQKKRIKTLNRKTQLQKYLGRFSQLD